MQTQPNLDLESLSSSPIPDYLQHPHSPLQLARVQHQVLLKLTIDPTRVRLWLSRMMWPGTVMWN